MKKYDFEKAKRYIQMHSDLIEDATLGIQEDWWWTSEEVYSEGNFTQDLDDLTEVAGITGSTWATPALLVNFKDGREEMLTCYQGESDEPPREWVRESLGVLSEGTQQYIDNLDKPKLN